MKVSEYVAAEIAKIPAYDDTGVKKLISDEAARADTAEKANAKAITDLAKGAVAANAAAIATLVGSVEGDDTKSARTIAAEEINRLIKASDDEGGETLENIGNLVDYVEKNAGEIAALITQANASTAKLADVDTTVGALIDSKIAAIPAYELPMATIAALGGVKSAKDDEDGKVAVNKVYVDQTTGVGEVKAISTDSLVQGSMTLILNGGNADLTA